MNNIFQNNINERNSNNIKQFLNQNFYISAKLFQKKNIFTTSKVEQSEYFELFWKFLIITSKKVKINEILAEKKLIISKKIKIL